MPEQIFREITPLDKDKLFFVKFTPGDPMTFPVHFHNDFEITLVLDVNGKRIIGNSIEHFTGIDLSMIFPDTLHGYKWDTEYPGADVVVIQFSKIIKDYPMFSKDVLSAVGNVLSSHNLGINYSKETAYALKSKIIALSKTEGIDGILLFIEILHSLSVSKDQNIISAIPIKPEFQSYSKDCERINRIIMFIEKNYKEKITLDDISKVVRMSPAALSRYFKKKTGYNLWEYLNNYRVDVAAHRMAKTDDCIYEICYTCGFNNVSNFNREFKKKLGVSPSLYKKKLKTIIH